MITDPDDPDYRYPQPGERLWHVPWQRWITIVRDDPDLAVTDEVEGVEDDGRPVVVKLRSLEAEPMPQPVTWTITMPTGVQMRETR